MKRLFTLFTFILTIGIINAQETYRFRTDAPQGISIESSTPTGLSLHYSISEIGIADEASAKAKSMLFLVSGAPGHKEKPSIFRIKRGSAMKVTQADLVSQHGYVPRKSEPGKEYWLWELEI